MGGGGGQLSAVEIDYWISKGPHDCQNRDASLQPSKRVFNDQEHCFSKSLFTTTLANGEKVSRDGLL